MSDTRPTIHAYRHRTATCTRLLFEAYLAPGSQVQLRCPACGAWHRISIPAANGHIPLHSTAPTFDIQNAID